MPDCTCMQAQEMYADGSWSRSVRVDFGEDCPAHSNICHCGRPAAAVADPGKYANQNMVDDFCGECITVRCDAFPGACLSDPQPRNFAGESSPIATNPILRGVDLAIDRLVAGGVFQGDAVRILDDLRSEIADRADSAVSDPQRRNGE